MTLAIIAGRGHSGTRLISQTMFASGAFCGRLINRSADTLPFEPIYEAASIFGGYVDQTAPNEWDFSRAIESEIPDEFHRLLFPYLKGHIERHARGEFTSWKIPELTLFLPWLVRLFPDAHFLNWFRHPLHNVTGPHVTDDLERFNVPFTATGEPLEDRLTSWKYQTDIMRACPLPERIYRVRAEHFANHTEETLERLERFLGWPLGRVVLNRSRFFRELPEDVAALSLERVRPQMGFAGYSDSPPSAV